MAQAKQKLWEYCNGMGKEAVNVVTMYMISKHFECAEDCTDYVDWVLSEKDDLKWLFHYEQVMEDEDGTMVSGFASPYIFAKAGIRRATAHIGAFSSYTFSHITSSTLASLLTKFVTICAMPLHSPPLLCTLYNLPLYASDTCLPLLTG